MFLYFLVFTFLTFLNFNLTVFISMTIPLTTLDAPVGRFRLNISTKFEISTTLYSRVTANTVSQRIGGIIGEPTVVILKLYITHFSTKLGGFCCVVAQFPTRRRGFVSMNNSQTTVCLTAS